MDLQRSSSLDAHAYAGVFLSIKAPASASGRLFGFLFAAQTRASQLCSASLSFVLPGGVEWPAGHSRSPFCNSRLAGSRFPCQVVLHDESFCLFVPKSLIALISGKASCERVVSTVRRPLYSKRHIDPAFRCFPAQTTLKELFPEAWSPPLFSIPPPQLLTRLLGSRSRHFLGATRRSTHLLVA